MLIPTILSGGTGARLWPVSRQAHPKPFMKLPDGQTLLQKTFIRSVDLPHVEEILIVTNRDYFFKTKDEFALLNFLPEVKANFLLEPVGRNTAPAIMLAAMKIAETYSDEAIMLVLPADHLIEDQKAFSDAVKNAYHLAQNNYLVTFGIAPVTPETGFGYIECGAVCDDVGNRLVARFVEKPSPEVALTYVNSGQHLWNSGIFCFKVKTILEQFKLHAAGIYTSALSCWQKTQEKAHNTIAATELDPTSFAKLTDISIDYAIMEKASNVAVVAGDFDWSDLGSWYSVSKLAAPDSRGNRVVGEAMLLDSANTYIQSEDRLVAAIGVENLIIIDTPDALLVANYDRAQDVKKVVDQLKLAEHESYKLHRTVTRPWGTYTVLEEGKGFKIKRIMVKPGASLSLQMHQHRSEHWVVVSGTARVTNGESSFLVKTNESTYIPAGNQHRLENPMDVELVLIEVQTGDYLGEDDIVRLEDKYGRVTDPVE